MGHWTNSSQQILGSGLTVVEFDEVVHPGSQTALQDGIYDYAYHINLIKPSGESGPGLLSSVLAVNREAGGIDIIRESRSFGELDTDHESALSHTGRTPLSSGDRVIIRVAQETQSTWSMSRIKSGQSSLTLDLVGGAAASGNFSGTSFPTGGLVTGRSFYREDINEMFHWNGTKWLGDLRDDGCGRTGTQTANTYFRRYNGQLMTATRGLHIPYDAAIVEVSWTKGDTAVGNIELQRDGVAIGLVDASAIVGGTDLDIDFLGNGTLSLFWNSANDTNNIQIMVKYRRKSAMFLV